MISKVFITAVIVVIIFAIGLTKVKRDLPFQEIIPMDGKIAIINSGNWYPEKIELTLSSENFQPIIKRYNNSGVCLFENLSNDVEYKLKIKRTDLKGQILYKRLTKSIRPRSDNSNYIVLLGASITKQWHLNKLPERVSFDDKFIFGYRTIYEFDKGKAIDGLLDLPVPVKSVIIKECSAYFPIDQEVSQKQIKGWIEKLKTNNIVPILATVVPVTKEHDQKHPGRFNSILKYNEFIRDYAAQESISVLDLARGLQISQEDKHLRDAYAQKDGNHLVKQAYEESLDNIIVSVVQKAIKDKSN